MLMTADAKHAGVALQKVHCQTQRDGTRTCLCTATWFTIHCTMGSLYLGTLLKADYGVTHVGLSIVCIIHRAVARLICIAC